MGRSMYHHMQDLPLAMLLLALIGDMGSAGRPVVTFNPNWNKILRGESLTMSCNVEGAASRYSWYHNNKVISRVKNHKIVNAWTSESGEYKCRDNDAGVESEVVMLSVSDGWVILQAPLYVYEGDDVSVRCHALSGYSSTPTIFYRNNQMIQTSDSDLLAINYTDLTATYRCSRQFLTDVYSNTYRDDTYISYTEHSSNIPVTFTPDWNKLLTGDNITMTCNGGAHMRYWWVHDGKMVAEGATYTISSAQVGHSGTYQCQTDDRSSSSFRLDVSEGRLILQAPIFVYRRANISLRCHSRPEYFVYETTFYKYNILLWHQVNHLILYGNTDVSGWYRCERRLFWGEYVTYTDEVSLHVRDVFSKPYIAASPLPMTEGDAMTLTCDTRLSPLRPETELQFAFYRDQRNVQEFGSSNQYEVWSAQLEDSGKYSCDVTTSDGKVRKSSHFIPIMIKELFSIPVINISAAEVLEGANMTLTCDTRLSPLRLGTELQFAFYRDGRNVQEFGSSNQYGVQSAQVEDSGNYSCDVRTLTNNVMKRSKSLSIEIQGTSSEASLSAMSIILIVVFILLFLISIIVTVVAIKCRRTPSQTSMSGTTMDPLQAEPSANSTAEEDVCYANLTIGQKASGPRATEHQVVYSEIKSRMQT